MYIYIYIMYIYHIFIMYIYIYNVHISYMSGWKVSKELRVRLGKVNVKVG